MADADSDLRAVFCAAMDCKTPRERADYLNRACTGKPQFRAQVEELLQAHGEAGDFLPEPPFGPGSREKGSMCEGPGTILGPYKLLEQIGEGGFGIVFMAEQRQPVRRTVALKILKPGMDSRTVIARFEAERQALALMDHPNIARVLDAGETASGRPHFVMELVRGVPITEHCADHGLTTHARLKLFVNVCQAVQHAHLKGIIHRDIKPSNVLVTSSDPGAPGVVKVIDFGIAKAIGQQLTEKTLHTAFAEMVGTPMYMSPEQAGMSGLDIDTRTDIYSLGVLAYELLTGTPPFDRERLRAAGYDEMRRIVREEEPPAPSKRLRKDEGKRMKEEKKTPTSSSSLIPHPSSFQELDWIVMKALNKDRTRRYESAHALAADVERYLRDEPVLACLPSSWYRISKLTRRHKTALTTAGLLFLTLVSATVVLAWQAWKLHEQEMATRHELGRAQKAEEETTHELFDSLVAQARANRLSRRIGQRFGTLEIVRRATGMAHQLELAEKRFRELRNEAIAALALPDLRIAKEWPDSFSVAPSFDASLEHYASADRQGTIYVRSAGAGTEICRLPCLGPGEYWPVLSPDSRYLAVMDSGRKRVYVWRLAGGEPIRILNEPGLGAFRFSPNSQQLVLQQPDGSIGLFDLATKTRLRRLPVFPFVTRLAFSPEACKLAVACASFTQVCDLETGKVLWRKDLSSSDPWVEWHPDGAALAVADRDAISLWDVAADKPIGKLEGLTGGGLAFAFNPTGAMLASIGWTGMLRLWDPHTGRLLFKSPLQFSAVHFSADGRFLAASRQGDHLSIWEIAEEHEYRTLAARPFQTNRKYYSSAFSSNGRLLAAGADGGTAIWDLTRKKELAFLQGSPGLNSVELEPRSLHESATQKREETLYMMGSQGLFRRTIRLAPQTGEIDIGPAQKLPVAGQSTELAQSRDGRLWASAQVHQGAVVLHADQPDQVIKLEPQLDVRHVALSPDGRWVATARFSYPGGIKIWEAARMGAPPPKGLTFNAVKDLPASGLNKPVFSPDGKRLLATSVVAAVPIRRWEVGTWVERPFDKPLEGQNAAFSPDGKWVVLETGLGVARLIDAGTGTEYARLEDPDQHRTGHFSFSRDGAELACATGDGFCLHVWDIQAIRRQLAEIGLDWK